MEFLAIIGLVSCWSRQEEVVILGVPLNCPLKTSLAGLCNRCALTYADGMHVELRDLFSLFCSTKAFICKVPIAPCGSAPLNTRSSCQQQLPKHQQNGQKSSLVLPSQSSALRSSTGFRGERLARNAVKVKSFSLEDRSQMLICSSIEHSAG